MINIILSILIAAAFIKCVISIIKRRARCQGCKCGSHLCSGCGGDRS